MCCKKKIHLRDLGLHTTLCGKDKNIDTMYFPEFAKKYSEVSCRLCMKSETYTRYLEGRYKEKPESYEQDCASGYYRTGKMVAWLQLLVDEFNPEEALALVEQYNGKLKGDEIIEIKEDDLLKMMTNTWALLAIKKEMEGKK